MIVMISIMMIDMISVLSYECNGVLVMCCSFLIEIIGVFE